MLETQHYHLKKPEPDVDPADVQVINENMDKLDEVVGGHLGDKDRHTSADEKASWDSRANPNMLLNSNFKNAVNQRGVTSWTGSAYGIDRWRSWNGNADISLNGVVLSPNTLIDQALEFPQSYKGQPITLSAEIDGEIFTATGIDDLCFFENTKVRLDIVTTAKLYKARIWNKSAVPITVNWVKLEYGTIPTPFIPRLYAEELALCQRYYLDWNGAVYLCAGITGSALASVQFPATMRIAPTIAIISGENSDKISYGMSSSGIHLYNHADIVTLMVSKFTADAEIY